MRNLENFIRVAQETDAKYIVFLDNDEESKNYTKKYTSRPKNHPRTIDQIIFLGENKTIEDYIPINILNDALKTIKSINMVPYSNFLGEWYFKQESVVDQIKQLTDRINNLIEENRNGNNLNDNTGVSLEKISSQDLKLELIIRVKELINSNNVDQFQELINHLKQIPEKAKEIYNI